MIYETHYLVTILIAVTTADMPMTQFLLTFNMAQNTFWLELFIYIQRKVFGG